MEQEIRQCQNCKNEFVIEPDDFAFYEKMKVPAPTFCPDCRQQRRMSWRNDYNFYVRECGLCKGRVLSIYSPEKIVPIYCPRCWWSDKWDAKKYGKSLKLDQSFFSQFKLLLDEVPALAILNDNDITSVNCQYTNYFARGKNCYMVINSWKVEDCMYSVCLSRAKSVVDCAVILEGGEQLYHAINADKSSRSRYVFNSIGLLDCAYCHDCRNSSNCFMCIGLRNKQYCFKNKQYDKQEYENILKDYAINTWTGAERARIDFEKFILQYPHKYANIINSVDCTGDHLTNSKNAKHCYIATRVEDSRYFELGDIIKDSYDCLSGGEQELCYESINPDNSYKALFSNYCHGGNNVFYSDSCQSSEYLFGCVGLKSAQYCILNEQYTKEEYEKLVPQLIEKMKKTGEYGEFFPVALSSFCYNETVAQDGFPLGKEEVLTKGLKWQDHFTKTEDKQTILELTDNINDVPDTITQEILSCQNCKRNYRIVDQELQFYRKNQIPVPRTCFFCRLTVLYKERGPLHLWVRSCMCDKFSHGHEGRCTNEFETSYAPDRPEIVYCEACYNQEVS